MRLLRVLIQDKMGIMNPTTQFLKEPSAEGEFERQEDAFREVVTSDGSSPIPLPPAGIISTFRWRVPGQAALSLCAI